MYVRYEIFFRFVTRLAFGQAQTVRSSKNLHLTYIFVDQKCEIHVRVGIG
jgi:hypothetical protein